MINDNVVPMPNTALHAAPVIIDDSRLQALWRQQHRRQNWIVGGCCATALLIAAALVIMAFRINAEPPKVEVAAPVINIPEQKAPVVNITVPEQPAPVVNITVPTAPASPAPTVQQPAETRTGESKVVTEYTLFTTATVGNRAIISGWNFRSSKDTAPYRQYCYLAVGRTGRMDLAHDGKLLSSIATDGSALGVSVAEAEAAANSCRWFNGGSTNILDTPKLRDPTR